MSLVKYKEATVDPGNVDPEKKEPLRMILPSIWLRDNCQAGDTLGVYVDSETKALIIATPEQAASIEKNLIAHNGNGNGAGN